MKSSTDAFTRLKIEQQRILDFALLVCHAMPNLSKTIKGIECKIPDYGLANPFYFVEIEDIERLKSLLKHSENNLAKYILFSSWSFFEFYFKDAMNELLIFYGGKENFLNGIKALNSRKMLKNKKFVDKTMKLRETPKTGKKDKYEKALNELSNSSEYTTPHP